MSDIDNNDLDCPITNEKCGQVKCGMYHRGYKMCSITAIAYALTNMDRRQKANLTTEDSRLR